MLMTRHFDYCPSASASVSMVVTGFFAQWFGVLSLTNSLTHSLVCIPSFSGHVLLTAPNVFHYGIPTTALVAMDQGPVKVYLQDHPKRMAKFSEKEVNSDPEGSPMHFYIHLFTEC